MIFKIDLTELTQDLPHDTKGTKDKDAFFIKRYFQVQWWTFSIYFKVNVDSSTKDMEMWNLYSCVNSVLISIIRNNRIFVTFQNIDQSSFWLLFLQTRCNVWSSVKLNLMEEKVMGNMIKISGFIFAILIDFVRKRGQCSISTQTFSSY